jgi:hypothetical protein
VNEQEVFAYLQKQKKAVLLDYLHDAFRQMTAEQRRNVFADAVRKPPKAKIDADELREEIEQFRHDSLARYYYAPFNVNSKNFMHIPEETHEWCDLFARFVAEACLLTANRQRIISSPRCFCRHRNTPPDCRREPTAAARFDLG